MFVRFVVNEIDPRSGRRTGVFHAAYAVRRSGRLHDYDDVRLSDVLSWFAAHLSVPNRLARSRRPHREPQAICWFKHTAMEHLARAREMQHLLDACGITVDMITTRHPGYTVYEDEHQVAAYPFAETLG